MPLTFTRCGLATHKVASVGHTAQRARKRRLQKCRRRRRQCNANRACCKARALAADEHGCACATGSCIGLFSKLWKVAGVGWSMGAKSFCFSFRTRYEQQQIADEQCEGLEVKGGAGHALLSAQLLSGLENSMMPSNLCLATAMLASCAVLKVCRG